MWEHMTEQQYQHEVIVPDKGFPFKLFLFEGHSGKYIREKHWHRSIEIFAVQEGELDFILDTTHYHLGEGEFIIVNSNEVHAIHANRPNHTIVLQIPLNQFASYFTGEQFIWFSHSERTYDEQVACLIFRMYKVYRMQTDGYDFEILSMFYQLLHILVKKYRKLDVQDELLKSNQQLNRLGMITSYLKDHYMEDISLGKLAGIFGYSPSYLSKMFARYAGINYKDYLQNIRLEHAVKDLENTDKQIVDIAFDHGFANSKAFTNLFRKRYGMLTSEYRKQLVKKKQRESYAHHRALLENNALAADNLDFFFELVRQSGDSSANLLQNLYSCRKPTEQGIPFGIMMSKRFLGKSGAVRVHGGGFAGTIQAFVPTKVTEDYVKEMEALFGAGSCYVLRIRPVGGFSFQA